MSKTKTRKVRDAIKTGKATKIKTGNQFDESSAGAMHYSEEETQQQIDDIVRKRIMMQNELRKVHLLSQYQYTEIEELTTHYNIYDKTKQHPLWFGIDMPKKLLGLEIHLQTHTFKETMRNRSYHIKGLENVGFNKEQMNDVMNGKIIKDLDKLKKMEKAHEKKQNK